MACIQVNCKPVALERNGIVKMVRVKIRPKKKGERKSSSTLRFRYRNIISGHEKEW